MGCCNYLELFKVFINHWYLLYVFSFGEAETPTSSRSLAVNTENPPHLCAETSCLAMKSLILWSLRLTYTRKWQEKKGLGLEYCNSQTLTLICNVMWTLSGQWSLDNDQKKGVQTKILHDQNHNPQWVARCTLTLLHGWQNPRSLLTELMKYYTKVNLWGQHRVCC